jgi:hypothetical protein
MSDVNSAMNALRRRLVGRSGAVENRAIDDLRLVASSAGGGVAGLETLMILASIADGGSSLDPQTRVLQARLARRDPKVADLVMKLGTAMFKNHGQLLRSEENRLKHGATAGLLRACMPATEQGQYGTPVTLSTNALPTTTSVIPPLDVGMFPPVVRRLCKVQIIHLQAAVLFCIARDQGLKDVPKTRKTSVFKAQYLGGHSGSSTQFLLWKLEFVALGTAEDCQQVIYGEQKGLGQLIFANTAAFRAEPFLSEELNSLKELLRKAELALKRVEDEDIACSHDSGSLSGKAYANDPAAAIKKATLKPKKSTFADCWDDPAFCHEVVVAQQLCENFVEDGADSPKSIMLKRFRLKPELAKYRALVEAHFAEFVSEPLPVAAQMKG